MRVLAAVVLPPHLSVSGASRAAERLSRELAPFVDIDVANMGDSDPGEGATTSVPEPRRLPVRVTNPLSWTSRFLPNRVRTLFYRSDIARRVRWGGYDLVHIHNPTPALEMWRVARAARRAGIPYVVSTHGFVEVADAASVHGLGRVGRAAWWVLVDRPVGLVVRNATRMLALSPADIGIIERFGGSAATTSIVANGVDLPDRTDPPDVADAPGLAEPGSTEGLRAFFLANHTPNKGLPVLLEAFLGLTRPFELIVGGDQRDTVDYAGYAARCGPGQRITFTGRLTDEEVAACFRTSDLFVFPTLADTFPLVVLEAMASGVPVVASDVGGIPYELDERCGVLVAPGDVEGLRSAVDELAGDPARLEAMGLEARNRVAERFTWSRAGLDAFEAYRLAVEGPVNDG